MLLFLGVRRDIDQRSPRLSESIHKVTSVEYPFRYSIWMRNISIRCKW